MSDEDLFFLLALQRVEGVGDIIAKKLLLNYRSAKAVFDAKPQHLGSIDGIGASIIKNIKDKTVFEKAEKELKFIRENNIKASFFEDEDYPERLKHCLDGPVLLFTKGNIDLKNKKMISIVGTRQVTSYGLDFCKKLIEGIIPFNPIIVSGFAYGVDIAAHQFAMENNLQTIGVFAHGLQRIYPSSHAKYCSKMLENGGFMTEFWSYSPADKENFIRRNRIVAGMSEALIVIESAQKGGSITTANFANDYNRDVFAVPGRVSDKFSQGCNYLIKTQKANILTSAEDLIYMLNWNLETKPKPIQKQLFVELDADESKVYDYLQKTGKDLLDNIALSCDFPIYRISGILTNMELKGIVRPLPGKLFEAI